MTQILRSALFKRQLLEMTEGYRDRACRETALKFVDQVDAAVRFIARRPLACAVYTELQGHAFRKWSLSDFPVSVLFRVTDNMLILEALYAHRMDIAARLTDEIEKDS